MGTVRETCKSSLSKDIGMFRRSMPLLRNLSSLTDVTNLFSEFLLRVCYDLLNFFLGVFYDDVILVLSTKTISGRRFSFKISRSYDVGL